MVNIKNYEEVFLKDVATIDRAKKGQIYSKGTTIIQVSATKGQVIYLFKDSEVEPKYACIIPNNNVQGYYLFSLIKLKIDQFMEKNKTGINIQMNTFDEFPIKLHDYETQKIIGDVMMKFDSMEVKEKEIISKIKDIKKENLEKMFI